MKAAGSGAEEDGGGNVALPRMEDEGGKRAKKWRRRGGRDCARRMCSCDGMFLGTSVCISLDDLM